MTTTDADKVANRGEIRPMTPQELAETAKGWTGFYFKDQYARGPASLPSAEHWRVMEDEAIRRGLTAQEMERLQAHVEALQTAPPPRMSIEAQKYPALRAIISIYQVSAILALVLGVAFALIESDLSGTVRVAVLLGAVLVCLFQWAAAETLQVVVDIEANTRRNSTR